MPPPRSTASTASSRAPAWRRGDPAVAPLLAAAAARGIAVGGELDLFGEALAGLKADRDYAPRLLAVTGTNGKTTTTALTALLVERAGRRVAVAGNIGPTLLGTLIGGARRRRAAARGLGAGAVELPTARRPRLRARRRRPAQPDAGSSRLAWHDGRLRRRQGAHLRPPHGARRQPRRSARRAHRDGSGRAGGRRPAPDGWSQQQRRPQGRGAGAGRRPLRPRRAAPAGRLRTRRRPGHGLAGAPAAGRGGDATRRPGRCRSRCSG